MESKETREMTTTVDNFLILLGGRLRQWESRQMSEVAWTNRNRTEVRFVEGLKRSLVVHLRNENGNRSSVFMAFAMVVLLPPWVVYRWRWDLVALILGLVVLAKFVGFLALALLFPLLSLFGVVAAGLWVSAWLYDTW